LASFSDLEIQYLKSQRLARIATASPQGKPDVSPVAFEFDGTHLFVGSHSQEVFFRTKKYKNIRDGNNQIAIVIDDLESVQPWKPRGIKVNGTAEIVEHDGMFGPGKYLQMTPTVSWSWGIRSQYEKAKEGEFFVKTVHNRA
jgi:pyridoxamine 5'-phosphate oxidase family protein